MHIQDKTCLFAAVAAAALLSTGAADAQQASSAADISGQTELQEVTVTGIRASVQGRAGDQARCTKRRRSNHAGGPR